MNKLFVAILLTLSSMASYAISLTMPIVSVTDGDTIRSSLKLPCPLCNVSIRLLNIDTPESTYLAKCPAEKAKGLEAKAFLKSIADGQPTMVISSFKWDKYGGRINAYVSIAGQDVGQLLIDRGLAMPYTGTGPKPNWCI